MKKLLSFLIPLLLCSVTIAQPVQFIGTPTNVVEVRGKLRVNSLKNNVAGDSILTTDVNGNLRMTLSGAAGGNCGLTSGGLVTWSGSGLTYDVTSATYCLGGAGYSFAGGSITLDNADPTNDRFDVLALNNAGILIKITGTPNANPQVPSVDPATQLYLTAILVRPGGGEGFQTVLWDENTAEPWEGETDLITTADFNDNTGNSFHGTIATNLTGIEQIGTVVYRGTGFDRNTYGYIKFFIKLKDPLTQSNLVAYLRMPSLESFPVVITPAHGLNKNLTGEYQNITIPLTAFGPAATGQQITGLGIRNIQSLDNPDPDVLEGYYIDYITLQGGVSNPGIGGNYVTHTFKRNDSVFYAVNGVDYFSHLDAGGSQNLAQVTANGNTTPDNIEIITNLANIGGFGVYPADNPAFSSLSISNQSGELQLGNEAGFNASLRANNLLSNQNIQLPNNSGTLALVGDLSDDIPRSGTISGSPVTGKVVWHGNTGDDVVLIEQTEADNLNTISVLNSLGFDIRSQSISDPSTNSILQMLPGTFNIGASNSLYTTAFSVNNLSGSLEVMATNPVSRGIIGSQDYTANTQDLDFVQRKLVQRIADSIRQELADSIASVKHPYKIYTALLSQTGTSAPTAIVLENTIGTVVFSYEGVGQYHITLNGAFVENKTFVSIGSVSPQDLFDNQPLGGANRKDDNTVLIVTRAFGDASTSSNVVISSDDMLFNTPIEIRVYN